MVSFTQNNNTYTLPTLSSVTKLSQVRYWRIYVIGSFIHRETWLENGKHTEFAPRQVKEKNRGRSNETTANQQALLEAESLWHKKLDKGYTHDGNIARKYPLPMLANKYTECGEKYLTLPFAVSRKLDGIRMMAFWKKEVVLSSRSGKQFKFLCRIREQLRRLLPSGMIVDGELYSHELPFHLISGAVRATKTRSEHDEAIEYWIFDIASMASSGYEERVRALLALEQEYNRFVPMKDRVIKFVGYKEVFRYDQVHSYHDQYVSEGYEGVMCRNLHAPYRFKHRSNDLLKYKHFMDDEFCIVDTKEGAGREKGAILFVCETKDGENTFDVRPRGTLAHRQELWKCRDTLVGKLLTVRYQSIGTKNAPRFPVGIAIRDYE